MPDARSIIIKCVILVMAAFTLGCTHQIVRVSDMAEIPLPEFVEKMKGVRIVFAGEVHNKKSHHKLQLDMIRALNEAGVDLAIGVEMFSREDQQDLDRWIWGSMEEDEFIGVYKRQWRLPWSQYRDIFLYAREHRVPVVALNVPRKLIHQVFSEGAESLTDEQKELLPDDLVCDVDPEYATFIREAMEGHTMDDATFEKFCAAQVVWDAAMAKGVVDYLEKNPGKKMLVLAGTGHSWKRGIPQQVEKLSGLDYLVILPEVSDLNAFNITSKDADYIWTGWFY